MAYLRELPQVHCRICGRPATHAVYNRKNANNGEYCLRHARDYLKTLNALEDRYDQEDAAEARQ